MIQKIDKDGLLLCDLQAKAFELSVTMQETGSAVFIRRFMNSSVAGEMDDGSILQTSIQPKEMLELVEKEYGRSDYGSVKYTENEMFWIGYIYRYFAYTYGRSSRQVYKTVKPKELRDLFLPYHTMDPAQAIDRILESKGLSFDNPTEERQYAIYRRIRGM